MKKVSVKKKINIEATQEKIFNFLTDPKNIPLILPGLIENTNIPKLPIKKGDRFKYKYQMAGFVFEGDVSVDKVEKPSSYNFTSFGGIKSSWKQNIKKTKLGSEFSLEIVYEVPNNILNKFKFALLQKINDSEAEHYLANLKNVMEI